MKHLDTHAQIKRFQIKPKKSLGQNFLVEPAGLNKVLMAAQLEGNEQVLEIGAGLGSLTVLLAQSAREVIAVEIDKTLFPALQDATQAYPNVRNIQGDILECNLNELIGNGPFVVVANIPYYITSAIIRHLLEAHKRPNRMILTIQKEVADRIVARDGKMSLLSLSVQVYANAERAGIIPAGAFYPAPDVDSAVLRLNLHEKPLVDEANLESFFKLAHAGFSQKRKTLRNSLSSGLNKPANEVEILLDKARIEASRRAETLTLNEWKTLVSVFAESEI